MIRSISCLVLVAALFGQKATGQENIFVHYINVGQGDSTLLEFPGCGIMLIDTGAGQNQHGTILTDYLDTFFSKNTEYNETIELIINTHPHRDHIKALGKVLNKYTVNRYVDNGPNPPKSQAITVRNHKNADGSAAEILEVPDSDVVAEPTLGLSNETIDPFNCENMDPLVMILSGRIEERPDGWTNKDFQNPNNHSLIIRIDFGQSSFLFTGDLEDVAADYMVDFYDGTGALDVDVYQVGYHGSDNGTTDDLINAMTPLISVISMGVWNFRKDTNAPGTAFQLGHPRRDVVQDLSSATSRRRSESKRVKVADGAKSFRNFTVRKAVYGTGWDGTVVIRASHDGTYVVTTNDNVRLWPEVEPEPLIFRDLD